MANRSFNNSECLHCVSDVDDSKEASVEIRNLITNLLGLICNGGVLRGLVRSKDFSRQCKMYMMSITAVDMLLNVTLLTMTTYRATGGFSPVWQCVAVMVPGFLCLLWSPGLVLALALDRLHAIFSPIKYRTQTRAQITAGFRILVAMAAALPTLLVLLIGRPEYPGLYCYLLNVPTTRGLVMLGMHIVLCGCLTILVYLSLACKMLPCCGLCRGRFLGQVGPLPPTGASDGFQPSRSRRIPNGLQEKSRKLTMWSAIFGAWFLVSYVPFGAYLIYLGLSEKLESLEEVSSTRFVVLTMSPFLNAVLDPFIVFCQLGGLRATARSLKQWGSAVKARVCSSTVLNRTRVFQVQPAV